MINRLLFRAIVALVALLAAIVVISIAVAFFGGALYLKLVEVMTPPMAALVTGLAALVVAALVALIGRAIAGRPLQRRGGREARAAESAEGLAAALGSLIGREAAAFARAHTGSTIAASLLAGFAVGASPDLRDFLGDLIRR